MARLLRWVLVAWLATLAATIDTRHGGRRRRPRPVKRFKVNTLDHFAEFCRRYIVLDNGRPFELEPFQRLILAGYFAGVTETLVLLPKKNGKTTLLAALALYHLCVTPDARCYIAASAKDQAKVMYDQACGFLERKDPTTGKLTAGAAELQKRLLMRKGTREIRARRDDGFIWVCSGDVNTVDGAIVTLGLVDELHRHKDKGALYGVLADGLGPRDGRIITISTAGESLRSLLGKIRTAALAYPGAKRKGTYTHATSPNGEFELHEWSLDEKDDREDLKLVKKANPLKANTIEKLAQRKKSPTMTASRWARFACGVWMMGEDAAYSSIDWSNGERSNVTFDPEGPPGYVGLDLAWRWDTTAAVPMQPHERQDLPPDEFDGQEGWWRYKRVRIGKPEFVVPPRNGSSTPHPEQIKAILAAVETLKAAGVDVAGVVFDRNAEGEAIAYTLETEHGLTVIEHSQDPSPMADASMGFGEALGRGDVEHTGDPELTAHVMACRAKTTSGEKWRVVPPEQNRGQRKKGVQEGDEIEVIDGAVATVMAHRVATSPQEPETEPLIAWR